MYRVNINVYTTLTAVSLADARCGGEVRGVRGERGAGGGIRWTDHVTYSCASPGALWIIPTHYKTERRVREFTKTPRSWPSAPEGLRATTTFEINDSQLCKCTLKLASFDITLVIGIFKDVPHIWWPCPGRGQSQRSVTHPGHTVRLCF